ncbi:MAG TPA: 7TM diverse intracellular signaling domain-containing protein [Ramlibacter sp.]|nr:7TM diverse intracellular signaling domain-containing protein [Ramlibacter sp.]
MVLAFLRQLAVVLMLLACMGARAAPVAGGVGISEISSWTGPTGQASVEKVERQLLPMVQWVPGSVQLLSPSQSLWIAMRLTRPVRSGGEYVIELPLPILDRVTVYQRTATGWTEESAGDRVPMSQWPIAGRYPTFPLHEGTQQVFVQVRHATPIVVPLQVTSVQAHSQRTQLEYLSLGTCLGILALLVAGSFMRAWVLRDRNYMLFSAYSLMSMLALVAITGIAAHLLWGDAGAWVDAAPGCLALLGGAIACYLTSQLAAKAPSTHFVARALSVLGWTGPPLALAYFLAERRMGLALVGLYLLSASIFGITAAVLTWQRGDAVGRWMLFGSTPLAAAVLVTLARSLSWVPSSWLTDYALVMALMLDQPLLLGAIRRRTEQRRTAVLRQLASQDQDPLTGLPRGKHFYARVTQAVKRWERHREPAAILMIEVANLAAISNAYGSDAAEESLLRAVIKLRAIARDVDSAGRLAPARFGLVFEGANTQDTVTLFGTRLIAAGLMRDGTEPELAFHIVVALLSEYAAPTDEMLREMGAMLSGMSPRTKRPMRFLTHADVPVGQVASDPPQESASIPLEPVRATN